MTRASCTAALLLSAAVGSEEGAELVVTVLPEFAWLEISRSVKNFPRFELVALKHDYEVVVEAVMRDERRNDYSQFIEDARTRAALLQGSADEAGRTFVRRATRAIGDTLYSPEVEELLSHSILLKRKIYEELIDDVRTYSGAGDLASVYKSSLAFYKEAECRHALSFDEARFMKISGLLKSALSLLRKSSTKSPHSQVAFAVHAGRRTLALWRATLHECRCGKAKRFPVDLQRSLGWLHRLFFTVPTDFALAQARLLKLRPTKTRSNSLIHRIFLPCSSSSLPGV